MIVCGASAGEQVKGRYIDFQKSSEKKKTEIDDLIDHEIDVAYKKAKSMLESESELHNLLIDAMVEFKTIDYEEIDLLLSSRSIKKLRKFREEADKKRNASGGVSKLIGNILSNEKKDWEKGQFIPPSTFQVPNNCFCIVFSQEVWFTILKTVNKTRLSKMLNILSKGFCYEGVVSLA